MASKEAREYSQQDVLNQCLVAFGQGTGCVRVSSGACREFLGLVGQVAEQRELHKDWGEIAVQMLERMRTIGRVAAGLLLAEGRVHIEERDVVVAFRRVQVGSKSIDCGRASGRSAGG